MARDSRGRAGLPQRPNQPWRVDVVSDALAWGRRIRLVTVVDGVTREALTIEVDTSRPGGRVVRVLERVAAERRVPDEMVVDNGPELAGKAVDLWAYEQGVRRRFIEPGKPIQNAVVERVHGRLRDEWLNRQWFVGLVDARHTSEAWQLGDHHPRPHRALRYRSPEAFRQTFEAANANRQEVTFPPNLGPSRR